MSESVYEMPATDGSRADERASPALVYVMMEAGDPRQWCHGNARDEGGRPKRDAFGQRTVAVNVG